MVHSELLLSAMTLAIATFSCYLLCQQNNNQARQPLLLLLVCLIGLAAGPLVFALWPAGTQLYIALLPVIFYLLLPALWCYLQALTAANSWCWSKQVNRHFCTLPLALLLSALIWWLPSASFQQLFFTDLPVETLLAQVVAALFLLLTLGWCALSLAYVIGIGRTIMSYHQRLKQIYANQQGKTLWWLLGLAVFIVLSWLYALVVLAVDEQFQQFGIRQTGIFWLLLGLTWWLASCGLRQRPGFAEVFVDESAAVAAGGDAMLSGTAANHADATDGTAQCTDIRSAAEQSHSSTPAKYQRSALSATDLQRIAAKLQQALQQDAVQRDEQINLLKLAAHIGVPAAYISQTLSQQLQSNFYDFINQARIEDAKQQLLHSDDSVLTIALAVGFNARSAFYKAFKQYTGMTPGAYKTQQRSVAIE